MLTLPANSTVVVTVYNFDGATAVPAQFPKSTGIEGSMTIQRLNENNPNAVGTTRTAIALDAKTDVANTFTITQLGLHVPIAANPKKGTYLWRCMDPCGTGPV